jgi:hypothetical protein
VGTFPPYYEFTRIMASGDHSFLDSSLDIDRLIARVEGKEEW